MYCRLLYGVEHCSKAYRARISEAISFCLYPFFVRWKTVVFCACFALTKNGNNGLHTIDNISTPPYSISISIKPFNGRWSLLSNEAIKFFFIDTIFFYLNSYDGTRKSCFGEKISAETAILHSTMWNGVKKCNSKVLKNIIASACSRNKYLSAGAFDSFITLLVQKLRTTARLPLWKIFVSAKQAQVKKWVLLCSLYELG